MTTVLNGGSASSCTLTGLMKYTKYEIFLIPFYKTVEGKPSNMIEIQTMEDGMLTRFYKFIHKQH